MAVTTVKQIAQQAGTTSTVSIYSPASANIVAQGLVMAICNYTSAKVKYRIFQDDDGSTYSTATALYYDVDLPANTTHHRPCGNMTNNAGNLAIYCDTASATTFTLYGTEIDSS